VAPLLSQKKKKEWLLYFDAAADCSIIGASIMISGVSLSLLQHFFWLVFVGKNGMINLTNSLNITVPFLEIYIATLADQFDYNSWLTSLSVRFFFKKYFLVLMN